MALTEQQINNEESLQTMRWVLDNANRGFYIFTADPNHQRRIAELFAKEYSVKIYDYSDPENRKPYSFGRLDAWTEENPASVYFVINFQAALIEKKDINNLNMSRDVLSRPDVIWFFGMTSFCGTQLSTKALDFYSFVKLKVSFKDNSKRDSVYHYRNSEHYPDVGENFTSYGSIEQEFENTDFSQLSEQMQLSSAITMDKISEFYAGKRNFAQAEKWSLKALEIRERLQENDSSDIAQTYHNLGILAMEQCDFQSAEQWYRKALAIYEKLGNEYVVAQTYHNLGILALEQRDFQLAEQWYRKALAIWEKTGNENCAAQTYHNMGILALDQYDFQSAEQWYKKSLAIWEKQGDENGIAQTYYQLGTLTQGQGDYQSAKQWYRKALVIWEKLGNEYDVAYTYHQLGTLAQEQRDYQSAEQCYRKTLAIWEKLENRYDVAKTYNQLGILYSKIGQPITSGKYFTLAVHGLLKSNDEYLTRRTVENFTILYKQSDKSTQKELRILWENAQLDFDLVQMVIDSAKQDEAQCG